MPEKTANDNVVRIALLTGDGIGTVKEDEDNTIEQQPLMFHLMQVIHELREAYGVCITLETHDLSEKRRQSMNPEELEEHYDAVFRALRENRLAMKMPGTTTTQSTAERRADELNLTGENRQNSINAWRRSPNARMRTAVALNTLTRPVDSIPELFKREVVSQGISVHAPSQSGFWHAHSGKAVRVLNKAELVKFAQTTVSQAEQAEKTEVVVATKHTISALDAQFLAAVQTEGETQGVKVTPVLFDSFLQAIALGQYENAHIACLPDQAAMLQPLLALQADDYKDIDPKTMPDRTVFRVAEGGGYDEELIGADESATEWRETHTVPEDSLRITFEKAVAYAKEHGTGVTVVQGDGVSPADGHVRRLCDSYNQEGPVSVHFVTLGHCMRDLMINPADPRYRALVCANGTGDYLSDFLAGLHYGKLGTASLGVGTSVDTSKSTGVIVGNPAAGTAPKLVENGKGREALPASIITSLAVVLQARSLPLRIQKIGQELAAAVRRALASRGEREQFDSYGTFSVAVISQLSATNDDPVEPAVAATAV